MTELWGARKENNDIKLQFSPEGIKNEAFAVLPNASLHYIINWRKYKVHCCATQRCVCGVQLLNSALEVESKNNKVRSGITRLAINLPIFISFFSGELKSRFTFDASVGCVGECGRRQQTSPYTFKRQ
jgi:hypothetical protein